MRCRSALVLFGPLALCLASLHAQTFEAAAIKRSAPNNPNGSTFEYQTGGGLRVLNGTLRGLIESAYDIREFQIDGGPSWLNVDRFDVIARSESAAAPLSRADDMKATRIRLQALLADRFHLAVHREMRELQEYALVVDKGGKFLAVPPTAAPNPRSGTQTTCGHMIATQATISSVLFGLSRQLRRPVVDRTGLTGRYDFELEWRPDIGPCPDTANDNAPSIFTALQEQVGLRLESIKGPVETIVVDRAERPSEN